jgi:hypothetical protein
MMTEESYRKEVEMYLGKEVSPEEVEAHRQRGLTPEQAAEMLKKQKQSKKTRLVRLI